MKNNSENNSENNTQDTEVTNLQNTVVNDKVVQGTVLQEEIINGLIQFLDKQNNSLKI